MDWHHRGQFVGEQGTFYSGEKWTNFVGVDKTGAWSKKNSAVTASWSRRWTEVVPFFVFSPQVRKTIYTTNASESLHSQVRKAIRNKGHFPSDEAATKLVWLALQNITAKWKRLPKE